MLTINDIINHITKIGKENLTTELQKKSLGDSLPSIEFEFVGSVWKITEDIIILSSRSGFDNNFEIYNYGVDFFLNIPLFDISDFPFKKDLKKEKKINLTEYNRGDLLKVICRIREINYEERFDSLRKGWYVEIKIFSQNFESIEFVKSAKEKEIEYKAQKEANTIKSSGKEIISIDEVISNLKEHKDLLTGKTELQISKIKRNYLNSNELRLRGKIKHLSKRRIVLYDYHNSLTINTEIDIDYPHDFELINFNLQDEVEIIGTFKNYRDLVKDIYIYKEIVSIKISDSLPIQIVDLKSINLVSTDKERQKENQLKIDSKKEENKQKDIDTLIGAVIIGIVSMIIIWFLFE